MRLHLDYLRSDFSKGLHSGEKICKGGINLTDQPGSFGAAGNSETRTGSVKTTSNTQAS